MIKVNMAEIETLTDILIKVSSDSDEVLNRLRQIFNEMHNDVELPLYPQSSIALEAVSGSLDAINRGNDVLQSLKNTLLSIATTYQETEKRNKDALNRMSAMMDNISVDYNAAIISNSITPVEHNNDIESQNIIQQMVADGVEEMQATNIAALTKAVREEYEISEIEDLTENY